MTGELLFLCHRIPFPPDRGDKIRSYHLLQRLAQIAPVHVGCFADDDRDMGFAPDMAQLTASQCVLMRDRSRISTHWLAVSCAMSGAKPMSRSSSAKQPTWTGAICASR